MKRSEARCALIDSFKNRSWGESTADRMLDVLEEVGAVKWEPEETPPPARLSYDPSKRRFLGDGRELICEVSIPEDHEVARAHKILADAALAYTCLGTLDQRLTNIVNSVYSDTASVKHAVAALLREWRS